MTEALNGQAGTSIDARINQRAAMVKVPDMKTQRGSGVGWDSPEQRAVRKGWHDVRSGRITPEAAAIVPVSEIYSNAWRTRGLPNPIENHTLSQQIDHGMHPMTEYSPQEPKPNGGSGINGLSNGASQEQAQKEWGEFAMTQGPSVHYERPRYPSGFPKWHSSIAE